MSQIPCNENSRADALAKSTSTDAPNGQLSAIANVHRPMVATIEEVAKATHSNWRDDILHYKKDATLPTDKGATCRVKRAEA
ncbi:hypothetical protein B296_00043472 [Ensete ventricosum]|uniref:Uncharacterized protein n=1 Tax=Ensete ventricosum TaxID=4639 RepID=A0A426X3N8_ENSVE|nr:hypothetical protein B296_00043472 [Ensete ventricosum]